MDQEDRNVILQLGEDWPVETKAEEAPYFDETGLDALPERVAAPEEAQRTPERKGRLFGPGRIILLVLFLLSGGFYLLCRLNSSVAEFYARSLYPPIAAGLAAVFGAVPFSVTEWLELIALCGLAVFLIVLLFRLIFVRGRGRRLLRGALALLFVISFLLSCYFWTGGCLYGRQSWAEMNGITVKKSDAKELAELYEALVQKANQAAGAVQRNEQGGMQEQDFSLLGRKAVQEVNRLAKEDKALLSGRFSDPKPVLLSEVMCYEQITGMFFPFTGEANINVRNPAGDLPATICHELAHQRGVLREEEANFLAVKTCLTAAEPEFVYSGCLLALAYVNNKLYAADQTLWAEKSALLSAQVKADEQAAREFWEQYQTALGTVSSALNDAYLQINGQEEGVRSYGNFVDLLLSDPEISACLN